MPVFKLASTGIEKKIIVMCDCIGACNDVRVTYWPDEDVLYFSIHLQRSPKFLKRWWTAFRYIFGRPCKSGEWDEIVLYRRTTKDLIKFLDGFVQSIEQQQTEIVCIPDDEELYPD